MPTISLKGANPTNAHYRIGVHTSTNSVWHMGSGLSRQDARIALLLEQKLFSKWLVDNQARSLRLEDYEMPTSPEILKSRQILGDKRLQEGIKTSRAMTNDRIYRKPSTEQKQPMAPEGGEYCTGDDFRNTLVPLYGKGWSIVFARAPISQGTSFKIEKRATLARFYIFDSFETALSFVQDLFLIASTLKVRRILTSTTTLNASLLGRLATT